MPIQAGEGDLKAVAADVVASLYSRRQIPPFSSLPKKLSVADAYYVTRLLRNAFEARGESIAGRKIGFTNRDMWKAHGVQAPIWGYCTDRTTHELRNTSYQCVSSFAEPRIEPEIIFGVGRTPSSTMDDSELLGCIDWVTLGFEIVQSIFPDWSFTASDTIVANALHGAILLGARRAVAPRKSAWQRELASFRVELYCNGDLREVGGGELVLGSPLLALRHLVELLDNDPYNPTLSPGEIVSTGTLTLAMPVQAGEIWTTRVQGIPLDDIALRIDA